MHGVRAGSWRRSAVGFGAEDLSRIAADSGALIDAGTDRRD
jgi:hypothetical protein